MHCVKSVQIRIYFWSVFFCIRTEYRKIRTRNNSHLDTFHAVMCIKYIQNVYHISTNFCVHFVYKIIRIMADKFCIQNLYKDFSKCGIHFVYKHFVNILYTSILIYKKCWSTPQKLCIQFVYKIHTECIYK